MLLQCARVAMYTLLNTLAIHAVRGGERLFILVSCSNFKQQVTSERIMQHHVIGNPIQYNRKKDSTDTDNY